MRHARRTMALFLATLMTTTALSACSGGKEKANSSPAASPASSPAAASAQPQMGGDLTVGIPQDLDDTLDPHKMVSAGTREVLFNVYEGLVKPDTSGNRYRPLPAPTKYPKQATALPSHCATEYISTTAAL